MKPSIIVFSNKQGVSALILFISMCLVFLSFYCFVVLGLLASVMLIYSVFVRFVFLVNYIILGFFYAQEYKVPHLFSSH